MLITRVGQQPQYSTVTKSPIKSPRFIKQSPQTQSTNFGGFFKKFTQAYQQAKKEIGKDAEIKKLKTSFNLAMDSAISFEKLRVQTAKSFSKEELDAFTKAGHSEFKGSKKEATPEKIFNKLKEKAQKDGIDTTHYEDLFVEYMAEKTGKKPEEIKRPSAPKIQKKLTPHQIFKKYGATLPKTPSEDEVKNAYKALARKYHPDKHPDKQEKVTNIMQQISEAKDTMLGRNQNL